jgi:site-specific DNA recombinase
MQTEPTSRLRAAAYSRVSTEKQAEEGFSLGEQEAAIRERAERDGAELPDERVFVDAGISGTRSDRPEYQRLLSAAAAGDLDVVYVWKLDRLGRDAEELLRARRMLEAAGVSIVSVTEGEVESKLVYGIRALVAEEERERIAERSRLGLRASAEEGRLHGGPTPYGYRATGARRERALVVERPEADVVLRIFREYLSGHGDRRIAHDLTGDRIPPRRAAEWNSSQVANILRSPVYVGRVRFAGETFPGLHEPIVDEATWEAAQARRTERREKGLATGRPPRGSHLLVKGMLRCGVCGGALGPRTFRRSRADGDGRDVYRCHNRNEHGSDVCDMPQVNAVDVDRPLLDYVMRTVVDLEATKRALEEAADRRIGETRAQRESAEREVARKEESLARIERDYLSGKLDVDDYKRFTERESAEREAALRELARLRDREDEIARERLAIDAERELLERLARLRAAIVERIGDAAGEVEALRAVLATVFEAVLLYRLDDELFILPAIRKEMIVNPEALLPAQTAESQEQVRRSVAAYVESPDFDPVAEEAGLDPDCDYDVGPEPRRVPLTFAENGSALSAGTNALLRLGATPLTCAEDVLEAFGLEPPAPPEPPDLSPSAARVLTVVRDMPSSADEAARAAGLGAAATAVALAELELAGLVVEREGVYRPGGTK